MAIKAGLGNKYADFAVIGHLFKILSKPKSHH